MSDITTSPAALAGPLPALQARALDAAANAIVLTDKDGTILYVNAAFSRVTGYSREEAVGRNPRLLRSGNHGEEFYRRMWEVIQKGEVWRGELTNRRKDGSSYHEEMTITPVRAEDGGISHYIAIKQDITERRGQERALSEAKEAAEAASRAKSEFLSTMSHEICTPLNAISVLTELLLESTLNSQQAAWTRSIKASGDVLLALVTNVLDYSRIETGRLSLAPTRFCLGELLNDTCEPLMLLAKSKGIMLERVFSSRLPRTVEADAFRLRQMLTNLLANAIKFTDAGRVRFEADCLVRSPQGDAFIQFDVIDSGIGMTEAQQACLFQPFTQADSSSTRRHGGTGLGLAICRRLLDLMGGTIAVQSVVGQGSTFRVRLRLKAAPPAEECVPEPSSSPQPRLRILVADDNPVNQQILQQLLGARGHFVVLANDGLEAIRHADAGPFDVILLDVSMPGKTGLDVARYIRSREPQGQRVPIIAVTANANTCDQQRCIEAGMDHLVAKPFRGKALLALVESFHGGEMPAPPPASMAKSLNTPGSSLMRIQVALEGADNDAGMLATLAQTYLQHTPQLVESLHGALVSRNAEASRLAHTLKGSVLIFGADKPAELAKRMEKACEAGLWDDAAATFPELEGMLQQLESEIRAFAEEHAPAF